MANAVEQLDAKIAEVFAAWNVYTTLIALVLGAFVLYPLFFPDEPDTHPLLLARQSTPSPIRHPGESATYRSSEVPHGYPLKTGLSVKEPGAPKWTAGKDGDLRDVWREAVRGGTLGESGPPAGLIMTVHGKDAAQDHDLADISKAINVIGKHLQQGGATRVAVYLPNSVEYLATVFACAFYGLTAILIPFDQPSATTFKLLEDTGADSVVAAAGSLPLAELSHGSSALRQVVCVVETSSRQMDWSGASEGSKAVSVAVWNDLVDSADKATFAELPPNDDSHLPGNVIMFWQKAPGAPAETTEFTQKNLVAAIGALISALPMRQRLNPSDLVLIADSFSNSYVLCLTLTSIFLHTSLAINAVAGPKVDLALVSRSVSPTVVIASAETLVNKHTAEMAGVTSGIQRVARVSHAQATNAGRMPTDSILFKLTAPRGSAVGNKPGKLRLLFVAERAGLDTPVLSTAKVAGAVAQTNMYDYRLANQSGHSHFGPPLSSVEVKLVDKDDTMVGATTPSGEIVVSGPAVAGGHANLGVRGTFREDCTLAYA
ncbi:hypothetical protein MBLNU459_g3168t2 [Dothideomycetes sp. NU459]